jgi:ABC-type transport system substrate-binding protein
MGTDSQRNLNRLTACLLTTVAFLLILAVACGGETEVVEKIVTQEVERIVEVEKIVEKEVPVEKIVTQVVVATPTPGSVTPSAPSGTVRYAYSGIGSPGYVPSQRFTIPMLMSMNTFAESLFYAGPNNELQAMLAESWQISTDGKSWTFVLREGIPWHDSKYGEVTAEDLKYSFEDAAVEASRNVGASTWRRVKEFEIADSHALTIHMEQAFNDFLIRVAYPYMGEILVSSKQQRDELGADGAAANPVGTGPFKFVEFRTGEHLKVDAFEGHWRATPAIDELFIMEIPEEVTRMALLLTDKVDIAQVSITQLGALEASEVQIKSQAGGGAFYAYFGGLYLKERDDWGGPETPWVGDYDDPALWEKATNVREAMSISIDRQAIVDAIFKGRGAPLVHRYYMAGAQPPIALDADPYDPVRAKQLLAEAGVPEGYQFTYRTSSDRPVPMNPEVAEAVAGFWRDLGFEVEVAVTTYGAVRPYVVGRTLTGHDMYQHNFGVTVAPALSWADSRVTFPPYEHPWMDERLPVKQQIIDQDELAQWNAEALQWETDENMMIQLVEMDLIIPVGPRIAEWNLNPVDPILGWELWSIKLK